MFEQRVKSVLIILGCASAVAVARIVQLQVFEGRDYRRQLRRMQSERTRRVEPVRGAITDRHGEVLVRHIPCWDIRIHYGVLSNDKRYLEAQARKRLAEQGVAPDPDRLTATEHALRREISRTWTELTKATGVSLSAFEDARHRAYERVERIRRDHERRSEKPNERVAEQNRYHAVVRGLDRRAMLRASACLGGYPWVEIRSSGRREYVDAEAFAHVLGRLGRVRAADKTPERDPGFGDELAAYRDNDTLGIKGAERLFEGVLRGRRGKVVETPDAGETRVDPTWGENAVLTIDAGLQRAIYARLREAVEEVNRSVPPVGPHRPCPGAAAVVLYMPPHGLGEPARREALALVSYPSYEPETYGDDYRELVRETWTRPLSFRAVYELYAPGSVVKPAVLAAALTEGVVTPDTRIACNGSYGKKSCWIAGRGMAQHHEAPTIDAELSLARSCNTYYYTVGRSLGAPRLRAWFRAFGLGQRPGLGLGAEESAGVVPRGGSALNLAIGQTLTATPLQVANLMATVATGELTPVTLEHDGPGASARSVGVREAHWRIIRNGLRRVVNEHHGTGYRYARLDSQAFELCGKTGSAQFAKRALDYVFACEFADGHTEAHVATDTYTLRARFEGKPKPKNMTRLRAAHLYPPKTAKRDTHAWFAGYLERRGARGEAPRIALAVILEFAGSGGHVAGPVARDIADLVIADEYGYVQRDAPAPEAHRKPRPHEGE